MSILSKKKRVTKADQTKLDQAGPKGGPREKDTLFQIIWGLGVLCTFAFIIMKAISPNTLQSTRFEYLLLALAVLMLIPYLGKFEAFGVKFETKKRVDEVEDRMDALDSRVKALPDYILGSDYFEEKDYDLAKECFLRSLKADPKYWPALLNLGTIELEEEHYKDAINNFKEVLEIDPGNVYAQNNLAEAYLYASPPLRNPERALGYAESVLKKIEWFPSALLYRCEALNRLNRHDEAVPKLKEILENNLIPTQRHWALYELALANSRKGQTLKTDALERMYDLAQDNKEGEYFLEMAEEEAQLFSESDEETLLNFVKKHKDAESTVEEE